MNLLLDAIKKNETKGKTTKKDLATISKVTEVVKKDEVLKYV